MNTLGNVIDKIHERRIQRRTGINDDTPKLPPTAIVTMCLGFCLLYPTATALVVLATIGFVGIAISTALESLRSTPAAISAAGAGPTPASAVPTSAQRATAPSGGLRGVVTYAGPQPARKMLPAPRGGRPALDESLLVNEKNGGLANAVVYLEKLPAGVAIPPPSPKGLTVTLFGARLIPHITLYRSRQDNSY